MTEERWQEIKGMVKDNFEVLDMHAEPLPEEMGPGEVEIVEFNGPAGRIRLTWGTSQLVLDKKTIGSRRIGSDTTVEYVYSETEKVHKFKVFRFDPSQNDWVELETKGDTFSF